MADMETVTGGVKALIGQLEADIQARQAKIVALEEMMAKIEETMTGAVASLFTKGNGAAVPAAYYPEPTASRHAITGRVPGKKAAAKAKASASGQSSAAFLAGFDRQKARSLDEVRTATGQMGRNIGVLIRHGYLKRKGDGYVRTAKVLPG